MEPCCCSCCSPLLPLSLTDCFRSHSPLSMSPLPSCTGKLPPAPPIPTLHQRAVHSFGHAAEQANKCYSRDFWVVGRVRVKLKNDDGTLVKPDIPNRKVLMEMVAERVAKITGRSKRVQAQVQAQQKSQASGSGGGGGGGGKSGKKKKKGKSKASS